MKAQLQLFPQARPLRDRLGEEPFTRAPRQPGVYIMTGRGDRVLYVGSSGNLRARLGTYRNARPDRAPAKIVRLAREVETITWEVCESVPAARMRENQLLRTLRPKFNRVGTYPRAYTFIWLAEIAPHTLRLGLASSREVAEGEVFGAFKSGRMAFAALLRLVWRTLHPGAGLEAFPALLLGHRPPRTYDFAIAGFDDPEAAGIGAGFRAYLRGESDAVLAPLKQPGTAEGPIGFAQALDQADAEILSRFFESGPVRNATLGAWLNPPAKWIAQDDLDDLLVSFPRPASP